jgi:hypothetical protein
MEVNCTVSPLRLSFLASRHSVRCRGAKVWERTGKDQYDLEGGEEENFC